MVLVGSSVSIVLRVMTMVAVMWPLLRRRAA